MSHCPDLSGLHENPVCGKPASCDRAHHACRLHTGSVVEEGLRWDVKVNSSDSVHARQVNKSLAAMLVLRSTSHAPVARLVLASPVTASILLAFFPVPPWCIKNLTEWIAGLTYFLCPSKFLA